jgi:hypothetical protein
MKSQIVALLILTLLANNCHALTAAQETVLRAGMILAGIYLVTYQQESTKHYSKNEIVTGLSPVNPSGTYNRSWLYEQKTDNDVKVKDNVDIYNGLGVICCIAGLCIKF